MARSPERIIAAAVHAGRIPRSRAKFYRDLADQGVDISYVDAYAAVPGLNVAASAAQDDEAAAEAEVYASLFGDGDDPPAGRVAASGGTQPSDDQVYQHMFPSRQEAESAADARLAAAASASSALSEEELLREMFGEDPT